VDVDWVVFDAVGTVIHPEPSVSVAYHTIGKHFGSNRAVEDVRSRFSAAFSETERDDLADDAGLMTSPAVEEARWKHVVAAVFPEVADQDGCFQELHDYFSRSSAWSLFDDTAPTLQSLVEDGFRLAIASNFDHRLHSICDGNPALSLFEKRYVSSELGYRKPSENFYRAIIADLNVTPERVLMVGDSLDNDVEGALAVGMNAALISREHSNVAAGENGGPAAKVPYVVIKSLGELKELLT
jgi:putative hydrolase of the HAD superfamily